MKLLLWLWSLIHKPYVHPDDRGDEMYAGTVEQMTPWEQVGYWKEKARQAEEAREAVNAYLPKYQQALADVRAERQRAERAEKLLRESIPNAVGAISFLSGAIETGRQLTDDEKQRVARILAAIRSLAGEQSS